MPSAASYQQYRAFYLERKAKGEPVTFIPDESRYLSPGQRLLQIMLIRHGEPLVTRQGWANSRQARQFLKDYDRVGIKEFQHQVAALKPNEVEQIHTSSLPRARHTVELIFKKSFPVVQDRQFREMERKLIALPLIKMPLRWWTILARVPWLLGLSRSTESFRKAYSRSKEATSFLAEEARKKRKAVLVAHGMLNRFLSFHLKRRGWKRVYHQGYGFLGVSVFVKVEED